MRSDSIGIYLGHKKINPVGFKAVYYGNKLIWRDVKSVSLSNIYYYYNGYPYAFYNYAVVQLQLDSSYAQLLQGKNIVSVELNGKTSDVEWTFPTSGSSLKKDYLVVEATAATFNQIDSKMKADYGISKSGYVSSVVIYYTD